MKSKKSIRDYIGEEKKRYFQIPQYQRGYKWGIHQKEEQNAAAILLSDIINAYNAGKEEYFIQGVTVYEQDYDVYLIDGQQRTTTLFILLSLLLDQNNREKYLFFKNELKLKYNIRTTSENFLDNLFRQDGEEALAYVNNHSQESQDKFNFSEAYLQMKFLLKDVDQKKICEYVLDHVELFYIVVNKEEATSVFSMMNGAKANMITDELIKADFLCKASRNDNRVENEVRSSSISDTLDILKQQIRDETAIEWESNSIRSRLARSWDKWLYWWNRPDVRAFFKTEDEATMELLLSMFCLEKNIKYSNSEDSKAITFKQFQNEFIKDTASAKNNFEILRKKQKRFEDLFNQTRYYNYLGLSLSVFSSKPERMSILKTFMDNFSDFEYLKRFVLLRIIDIKQNDIQKSYQAVINDELMNEINAQIDGALGRLDGVDIYNTDVKEYAFRILFMLNVKAANDDKKKFKFYYLDDEGNLTSIYSYRSLEHIWPKSKVAYKKEGEEGYFSVKLDEKTRLETDLNGNTAKEESMISIPKDFINRDDFKDGASEHCLGNLVFLHKSDNSKFNAKVPEDKKKVYFNLGENLFSRDLMHTISAFAGDSWSKENAISRIESRKLDEIQQLKDMYESYKQSK